MMKAEHKAGRSIDLLLHILILVTTGWAVAMYFFGEPDILGSHDVQCFKYFTTDSNILAAMGSAAYLTWRFMNRHDPARRVPTWLTVFKFAGTVAASITLLTVALFLAPMAGFRGRGLATVALFFTGNVFVLHLSTPVLAIITTLFLERDERLSRRQALWGTLPTVLYSFVYLFMVVIIKRWTDWYGFTFGGRYELVPVVMIVMYLFSLGVALVEHRIKCGRRKASA